MKYMESSENVIAESNSTDDTESAETLTTQPEETEPEEQGSGGIFLCYQHD